MTMKKLIRKMDAADRVPSSRPWARLLAPALVSGSVASIASAAVAAACGQRHEGKPAAPINAISHWLWDERAFANEDITLRHTVVGYAIHHAMSVFWALVFEGRMDAVAEKTGEAVRPPATTGEAITSGLAVAATACFVDYNCTPDRLTPGFEHKLPKPSLFAVYASFGLGLAAGHLLARRLR
jgi:hypothetical protein